MVQRVVLYWILVFVIINVNFIHYGLAQMSSPFDLTLLDGTNGFVILGKHPNVELGNDVSIVGDLNNDGLGEVIMSSMSSGLFGPLETGRGHVIFGSNKDFLSTLISHDLGGFYGFQIRGSDLRDHVELFVGAAGDINHDGFEDVLIGAPGVDIVNGEKDVGESYIVFGREVFGGAVTLKNFSENSGFSIPAKVVDSGAFGSAISGAGDINNDGIDDIAIASKISEGAVYVIFGSETSYTDNFDLGSLDGSNGFVLVAAQGEDSWELSFLGDFNGDGIDDLMVGAEGGDPNGKTNAGITYVIFGNSKGFAPSINLSSINGSLGFRVNGLDEGDGLGAALGASDINGDGLEDLAIAAPFGDANNTIDVGEVFVIYGTSTVIGDNLDLSMLNGVNGFVINGTSEIFEPETTSGMSVSGAGDFNDDGVEDLIIGKWRSGGDNLTFKGNAHVVYGRSNGFGESLDLISIDGTNGVAFNGIKDGDALGKSVSGGVDMNGDGIDDILIGAPFVDLQFSGDDRRGEAYVIFGQSIEPPSVTTGVEEFSQLLNLYPNPSHDFVQIALTDVNVDRKIDIHIYDLSGELLRIGDHHFEDDMNVLTVDIQHLLPGLYVLTINSQSFSVQRRFIKR